MMYEAMFCILTFFSLGLKISKEVVIISSDKSGFVTLQRFKRVH